MVSQKPQYSRATLLLNSFRNKNYVGGQDSGEIATIK